MIEVVGLTKQYGSAVVVRDLSFHVARGSVLGLLGPNGAGKTTTLRMLAGVLGPTHGTIRVCGHDLLASPLKARRCLGYLAESSPLYPEMTPRQYLSYRLTLKGVKAKARSCAIADAAELVQCTDVLDLRIDQLSRGFRQRVGLAAALQSKPDVIILDEPTAGLDPNQIRALRGLIEMLKSSHTVLLSTHDLGEVESLCTHALILHKGQLVAHDALDALRAKYQAGRISLSLRDCTRCSQAIADGLGWRIVDHDVVDFEGSRPKTASIHFTLEPVCLTDDVDAATERLISELVRAGVGIQEVRRLNASLETVFAQLTQSDRQAPP